MKIYFTNLQAETGRAGILGVAYGSRDDSRVEIAIDRENWDRMSDLEKTTTMYHELSHDILNAAHVNDETHLMHPTYQYESITELVLGLTKIFKEYKESNLKQFN